VVAKVRESLSVDKQRPYDLEKLNLKKVHEVGSKEKYEVEVSNRFTALEDLDVEVEMNSVYENFQPMRVYIIMNLRSISKCLMKDA
jgi:hypothetical protein